MNTIKKILAIISIVLAVVFLVASLVGIGGVWIVRARVNTAVNNLFEVADKTLIAIDSGVDELLARSEEASTVVGIVKLTVEQVGTKVEETPVLLEAADAIIDAELKPGLEKFKQASNKFYTRLVQLQATVDALNSSFLFKSDDDVMDKISKFLDTFVSGMEQLDNDINELTTSIKEAKAGVVEKVVERLTKPLNRIDAFLVKSQDLLANLQVNLSALQVKLQDTQVLILQVITLVTLLLSLIFIWIAFSQVIVIRWARDYWKSAGELPAAAEALPEPEGAASEAAQEENPPVQAGDHDQQVE